MRSPSEALVGAWGYPDQPRRHARSREGYHDAEKAVGAWPSPTEARMPLAVLQKYQSAEELKKSRFLMEAPEVLPG